MFTYVDNEKSAKIKVIGVGGAGGNAINNMIASNLQGVKFICRQHRCAGPGSVQSPIKIQLGEKLTEGLGAGANRKLDGKRPSRTSDACADALEGSHMVFITAGLGGGTGTGAAPVIAEICKELGILTVAVVTKPFSFEGKKRSRQAEEGLESLKKVADTVITIPTTAARPGFQECHHAGNVQEADEMLLHSVKGITDLIMMPGLVNLDFADVKNHHVQSRHGHHGHRLGQRRKPGRRSCRTGHLASPAGRHLHHRRQGVLMNITSTSELTMEEMTEASDRIYNEVGEDADIIWGTVVDDSLGDEMRVTVIATGIGGSAAPEAPVKIVDETYGGKLRPVTADDLQNAVNYDEPAFMRRRKVAGGSMGSSFGGFDSEAIDESDLDVPTFLRRKAD